MDETEYKCACCGNRVIVYVVHRRVGVGECAKCGTEIAYEYGRITSISARPHVPRGTPGVDNPSVNFS